MERVVYDRMAELDSRHWWYRARRDILARLIERKVRLPSDARILEIGCGTGHNLAMLARFGTVDGIEIDAAARAVASERLGRPVGDAPLPALTGDEDGRYDQIGRAHDCTPVTNAHIVCPLTIAKQQFTNKYHIIN